MTNPTTEESLLPEDPAHASGPEAVLLEGAPVALEPEPEAASESVRFTMREVATPAAPPSSKGNVYLWLAAAGLVLLGAGLAGAPHASAWAARKLAPLRAPELYGGLLITAGLGLFIGGVLRRSLTGIRGALAELSAETSRLDQVSHDTQTLCTTVEHVQASNEESKAALANLHKRIERLTEIASDPDHTVSMFRLAASVDQLGARLDLFIKDQFKSMNQQLGSAVGQAQQIERNLLGRLTELGTQVGTQLGDQLSAQRHALTEGFERTAASTARASSGIEANLTAAGRIEGQLTEHKKALALAVETLAAERAKALARVEARLAEHKQALHSAVDSLGAGQVDAVERIEGTLAQYQQALGGVVDSLAAGQVDAAERIEGTLAQYQQVLRSSVDGLAAEQGKSLARVEGKLAEHRQALGSAVDSLAAGQMKSVERIEARFAEHKKALTVAAESLAAEQVKAVVHIEGRFAEQQQALGSTVESLGADQLQATAALHASLTGLGERFEQHLQEQTTYVAECLGQLDGALDRSGRERDTVTRELAARLEQQLSEQSKGLQLDLAPLAEAARRSAGTEDRLYTLLAELETHVAAQVQNLQLAMAEGLERTRVASSETYEAATEGLQAAARLESRVHECQENLSRAFSSTREDWKAGLSQIGGTLEREVKTGNERNSQSIAVTKRIEIEIAANSSRLERIADELRGLASLALEIRDARQDVPAARPLVMDPPPALPMQRDTPSDVIP